MTEPGSDRYHRDYERLLNPTQLRGTLMLVSLFVLAFEFLRERVTSHVRMLFWHGIDQRGHHYDEEAYKREILSRHPNALQASLLWFREANAIDDSDLAVLQQLRSARNTVVHELSAILGTDALDTHLRGFDELVRVFRKIEVWWIVNFEIDGDPDWADREISEDGIIPGPMMMLQILRDVALGRDEEAWQVYREVRHHAGPAASGPAPPDGAT